MPRRKVSFDVEVNTPSAQREADRVAQIFNTRLSKIQVGTQAGGGAGGGGGGSGSGGGGGGKGLTSGLPGSSLSNLIFGSAQFSLAGQFYHFFSNLPSNIAEMDKLATANRRATASFATLAGGAGNANKMVDAFVRGTGNISDRAEATQSAMKLYNLGLATNAQQMQKFTTVSRGMAQATGKDPQYIQEQFSLAMSNQSLLRFDQLGLSIGRHKEIMADLQKQYPEMTREVAFQNAMLQQATEKFYGLATAQEALATSTEIVTRKAKDMYAAVAQAASANIMQPIAALTGKVFGVEDANLDTSLIDQHQGTLKTKLDNLRKRGGPNMIDQIIGGLFYGQTNSEVKGQYNRDIGQTRSQMALGQSVKGAMNYAASAQNAGVEIPQKYIDTIKAAEEAYSSASPAADSYITTMGLVMDSMARLVDHNRDLESSAINLGDATALAAQQVDDLAGSLEGIAVGLVGKLMDAGASVDQIKSLVHSQDDIDERAKQIVDSGAMAGDVISDEIALQMAKKDLFGPADDFIQNSKDAASESKRASSAAESAAKKWEKTVADTADKLRDTFSDMIHNVEGVFGKSEVTDEDLRLAELGQPVNYADDYRRRVEDVGFNKTKRDDVDMNAVRQALHLGADVPDEAVAILFSRAWQDQSLFANPENISKFMNVGATKQGLHGQEMGALGSQNLEAFFGLGTEQGNQFLKVFGVKIMDPIHDGLISEVTTRGPLMGKTIADAMYEGFQSQAMKLPWVEELMRIVTSQAGRDIAADQNANASSDLATSESVAYTTQAGLGVLH